MKHVEYLLRNNFDIIGKTVKDFPFDEYADFFIDCRNPNFVAPAHFNFYRLFWEGYSIKPIGLSSPYLVYRVEKET